MNCKIMPGFKNKGSKRVLSDKELKKIDDDDFLLSSDDDEEKASSDELITGKFYNKFCHFDI